VIGFVIPFAERNLRNVLADRVPHYNRGRPHASVGPGIPDGRAVAPVLKEPRIPDRHRVVAKAVLGGLHHEYRLKRIAA